MIAEVRRVAALMSEHAGLALDIDERAFGGASYDLHDTPLTEEAKELALLPAVLMGAVGGPKWAGNPRDKRPEAGLLNLRKAMDAFANLRPAICFEALADASTLKREIVAGLDIAVVREAHLGRLFRRQGYRHQHPDRRAPRLRPAGLYPERDRAGGARGLRAGAGPAQQGHVG